jgi:hypothetical protein
MLPFVGFGSSSKSLISDSLALALEVKKLKKLILG